MFKQSIFKILVLLGTVFLLVGCSKLHQKEEVDPFALKESKIESMTIPSQKLGKDMNLNVYLPKGYSSKEKYPVLYMIHGYTGSEYTWVDLKIQEKADQLMDGDQIEKVIIVMPDMENSFGLNSAEVFKEINAGGTLIQMGKYEDYLTEEIISYIDEHYNTKATKESRYIGGLSMGGFIAIRTAFRHPEIFSRVGGHSPALFITLDLQMKNWLFPNEEARAEGDPLVLAEHIDLEGISVYLDCGDQDSFRFYEGSEKLYNTLKARGLEVEYHLNSGGHTGTYWGENLENYLLFYAGKR